MHNIQLHFNFPVNQRRILMQPPNSLKHLYEEALNAAFIEARNCETDAALKARWMGVQKMVIANVDAGLFKRVDNELEKTFVYYYLPAESRETLKIAVRNQSAVPDDFYEKMIGQMRNLPVHYKTPLSISLPSDPVKAKITKLMISVLKNRNLEYIENLKHEHKIWYIITLTDDPENCEEDEFVVGSAESNPSPFFIAMQDQTDKYCQIILDLAALVCKAKNNFIKVDNSQDAVLILNSREMGLKNNDLVQLVDPVIDIFLPSNENIKPYIRQMICSAEIFRAEESSIFYRQI